MSKLISWYIEYCKKIILFPFEFLTNKKIKTSTKIIVSGVFLVLIIIILPKKNKNDKFRLINEADIEFIKDPGKYSDWSDINLSMKNKEVALSSAEKHLKSKVGERVGYVITLGEIQTGYQTGKRIINIRSSSDASIRIPFTYERNCPSGSSRTGDFSIDIDCNVDTNYQNKKCIVKGNIKDLSVKIPNHACDEANATVYLEKCSIELYMNKK
jgi:hypothetical protein